MANEERRRIISILAEIAEAADRGERITICDQDRPRLQLASELVESEHVRGGALRGSGGVPVQCDAIGLTTAGREHLDELRAKEYRESAKGRLLAFAHFAGGSAFGAAVATVTSLLFRGCSPKGGP